MDINLQPQALQKLNSQNTPFIDKLKPIKKDGASNKKDQLLADRDAYLQLLLAQLKNQNPQNPADTNQMTQNIVAISQAEQSITTNEHLEKLVDMHIHSNRAAIVNYIGKEVEYDNSTQPLSFGSAKYSFTLPEKAESMKISIIDNKGFVVRTIGVDDKWKQNGTHEIEWDGKNNKGERMPDGDYKISIEAYNQYDTPIKAITTLRSKVEGITENMGKYELLLAGNNTINVDDVIAIHNSSANYDSTQNASNLLDMLMNQNQNGEDGYNNMSFANIVSE